MRLVIVSYVGNEEDIIESFVRHNMRVANKMIVICTTRSDRTLAILQQLHAEGFDLDIRQHEPRYHDQAAVLTSLLPNIDADWVLPLDADEFVRCADINGVLSSLPRHHVTLVPWKTYVPTALDDVQELDVTMRITHRRSHETPQFYKILIPGTLLKEHPIIAAGNHLLLRHDTGAEYPTSVTENMTLAHFPVRSVQQIKNKVTRGWHMTRANPAPDAREAFHWKDILHRFDANDASIDLTEIALRYAGSECTEIMHDPVTTPMSYTDRMQ